ncbi:MAG: tRNA pseudouridine synthase A [Verrucomicrobia bacterium]|nr:tRNA pseudouridine synthase A [Verrucomicrobiota bacterium]
MMAPTFRAGSRSRMAIPFRTIWRAPQLSVRAPVRIHASGRTDSGVHARAQVFHFDGEWAHGGAELLKALRVGYPDSIQVLRAEQVPDDFHARFSAVGKRYVYQMYAGWADPFLTRFHWSLGNWRPDVDAMNQAARHLLGEHDFSAFGANPRDNRSESPVKRMDRLEVFREGDSRILLVTEASGYLFRMVRSLAGCLVDVGIGRLCAEDVLEILHSKVRTQRVRTAPARGLFLDQVFY